ncbi:MAG TPA: hypothetical protein VGG48_02770 [Rhizomicrobium sp.]
MSRTVDKLQKQLQEEVFHYAQDSKKAAGRALGTIIEIITYYKICAWGLSKNTLIEKPIPEFGRSDIRHNVEFSLHKVLKQTIIELPRDGRTITAKVLGVAAKIPVTRLTEQLLSSKSLLRNSAVISEHDEHVAVANLLKMHENRLEVLIAELDLFPAAIFECKRVGVEEGMKKGPQSIEKAKQGAYVARSVSALQKVIDRDGQVLGFLPTPNGKPLIDNYDKMLAEIVSGKLKSPDGFVLTVGVVSNHGNWFTSENMNKELKVLAAAYDWLLFLTDEGLMDFVEHCILKPDRECESIQRAFMESYTGEKGGNRFTKTRLDLDADQALRRYFVANNRRSDGWFNVIAPGGENLQTLTKQLTALLSQREGEITK